MSNLLQAIVFSLVFLSINYSLATTIDPISSNDENIQPGLLSDKGIIEETSSLQKQAEELKKKIDDSQGSQPWIMISENKSEYLKQVRNVRSRLSKKLYELKGFLENAKSQRAYLYNQIQSKLPSEEEKRSKLEVLESDIEEAKFDRVNAVSGRDVFIEEQRLIKKRLEDKQSKSNPTKDEQVEIEQLREQVRKNDLRTSIDQKFYEYGIRKIDRKISLISKNIEVVRQGPAANQEELNRLQAQLKENDIVVRSAQAVVRASDDSLISLDDMSGVLLQTDLLNLNYSDRSTWVFGALVGLVIFGFFYVARRSEKVTNTIFTGDSGIQFVTLFSVVIAIILFGILRILEGKELSALLGGLSGYILGRGNQRQS